MPLCFDSGISHLRAVYEDLLEKGHYGTDWISVMHQAIAFEALLNECVERHGAV